MPWHGSGGATFSFGDVFGDGMGGRRSPGGGSRGRHSQPPPDLYPKGSKVAKLSEAKFPKKGSAYVWLVHFYSPRSSTCRRLVSTMERLGEALQGVAKVVAVDCSSEDLFCSRMGVDGFPSVQLVVDGQATVFEGNYEAKPLHEFTLENLPADHVANVRRKEQADEFLRGPCVAGSQWGVCGILFTDKFDTSPALKSLAFRYRDRVAFGEVRGRNDALARAFYVDSQPKLLFFCGGDAAATFAYEGELRGEALVIYVKGLRDGKRCEEARQEAARKKQKMARPLRPDEDFSNMRVREMRELLGARGEECVGCVEKADFIRKLQEVAMAQQGS
ncbi:unnamed protein product [Discosporangium mesarthrocarpum]